MKLTGHLTESIYRRYAIVSPADLKAGVEKLARLHVEQSEPAKVVVVLADRKTRTWPRKSQVERVCSPARRKGCIATK